jgi:16S rRNA (cytosine967-C5)-methyltransferase
VTDDGAYSTLAMRAALQRSGLAPRDRALAAELGYGALRRRLALDWALSRHTRRPLARAGGSARALLRVGAYQLLFTRIPDHAAIDSTVALATTRERGFVNAVLRALAADRPPWPEGTTDDAVSIRTGMAPWAVRELRRLVESDAETERAAHALAARAPLAVRANRCRIDVDRLVAAFDRAGYPARSGLVHADSVIVEAGDPTQLPGYEQGWFAVQDQASSFVVTALDPQPGERVLDACAGPGGKVSHIACLVADADTIAADLSPTRARLVSVEAQRLGVTVRVLAQDARHPALRGPFDRILVDAPCSGLGAARRRPELLWRAGRSDLSTLARLQVAIVAGVTELLKPGGTLVYSVCTFPRAETDAACDAIVRHRPDLEPAPVEGPDGAAERIRLWPHRHGTDAMFIAGFRRR